MRPHNLIMMSDHQALIADFYKAFGDRDFRTMQHAYHPDAEFSDPVFPILRGGDVGSMWQMLVTSATDLRIEADKIMPDADGVRCRWQAWYTFSKTGRPVHNIIDASFHFRNGKIISHTDHFDFFRWSRQAFGLTGTALGWTPMFKSRVRETAARSLHNFIHRRSP